MGFLSALGGLAGGLIGGPTGAMVGSSIGGMLDGQSESNAAQSASDAQSNATNASIAEQRRQYDLTRGDYAPYREAGVSALGTLQSEMDRGISSSDVTSGAGYQFGLQQGQQGLDRKAAAGGGRVSGAALKSAAEYATNYATTGYNAEYQRRQDRLNRLASLAGIGQSATGSSAQAGAASTNAISALTTSQGDASAAGKLAQGNIWQSTGNQLGAALNNWSSGSSFTPSQIASANSMNVPTSAAEAPNYW